MNQELQHRCNVFIIMSTQRPNSQMTCSIPRGRCSDLHTDPEAQGVSAAACSAPLKANSIDSSVWDVQPHPLLFLLSLSCTPTLLPFFSPLHPVYTFQLPPLPTPLLSSWVYNCQWAAFWEAAIRGRTETGGFTRKQESWAFFFSFPPPSSALPSLPPSQERPQTLSSSLWIMHSSNWNNLQELCVLPS